MRVEFKTNKLRDCYLSVAKATRAWGDKVARRYIERVNVLKAAKSAADLYRVPTLYFHPLKGDKDGQYSITLIDRWRMVVSLMDETTTVVLVREVNIHYGD